jgi:GNAT superfamily N-acetyltransferase
MLIKTAQDRIAELIFADLPLARRVEAAWDFLAVENAAAQRGLAPESGAEAMSVGGGHAVFLGPGSPLSQAQGMGLHGSVSEAELARMEAFFRDRSTPIQIEVSTLADPSLLSALSQRGYLIMDQSHTLVCPLQGWSRGEPPVEPTPLTRDLEIVLVDSDGLARWVDVVLDCFFEGANRPPPSLRDGAIAMTRVAGLTAWLALVNGRPAGGGSMMIHGRLALIAGDGTLANYRHRGVQTALLRARLAYAAEAGCDLAAICTQPGSGSQRNAERQGFRVVYARTMFLRQ